MFFECKFYKHLLAFWFVYQNNEKVISSTWINKKKKLENIVNKSTNTSTPCNRPFL